jgi:hypothetical protein
MSARKYEKPLHVDMDFAEALERFGGTDVRERPYNVKLRRSRGKAERKKRPATKPTSDLKRGG